MKESLIQAKRFLLAVIPCFPAPAIEKLPDNLIPFFAPIDDNFAAEFNHPTNINTYQDLKKWCEMSKNVRVWYYPNHYCHYVPLANIERLVKLGTVELTPNCAIWFEAKNCQVAAQLERAEAVGQMIMRCPEFKNIDPGTRPVYPPPFPGTHCLFIRTPDHPGRCGRSPRSYLVCKCSGGISR